MNSTRQISLDELTSQLAEIPATLIIDVLSAEEFKSAHLPGARNACVFDMTFLDDVKKLAPDLVTPLILYSSSVRNLASHTAAEKLAAAGYTHLADYRGGLENWRAAGHAVEGYADAVVPESKTRDGTHQIDLDKSKVEWTGRNLIGAHSGTLKLREGNIQIENGRPMRGSFSLEMQSIECTDLTDGNMRGILETHLKSDDFFDVSRFPEAVFLLSQITPLQDAPPGNPNCEITGDLNLKGATRNLVFRAILAPTPEGLLAVDAHFDIDRTQWNVLYGSGKFYEKLGKHLVNDEISLTIKIITLPPKGHAPN
jgi:polyisoprenoid-binding protein YceI